MPRRKGQTSSYTMSDAAKDGRKRSGKKRAERYKKARDNEMLKQKYADELNEISADVIDSSESESESESEYSSDSEPQSPIHKPELKRQTGRSKRSKKKYVNMDEFEKLRSEFQQLFSNTRVTADTTTPKSKPKSNDTATPIRKPDPKPKNTVIPKPTPSTPSLADWMNM